MCTMGSTEAEPMQCRHASRLEEYTGDYTPTDGEEEQQEYEPKVVDCYLGDTFSKTDCTDIEKIDGLGCYFEEMMCKCLNPENLPVDNVNTYLWDKAQCNAAENNVNTYLWD